jgi:hypothetical protein
MTIKHPARSTIIAAFGWPYSVAKLVSGFAILGRPTTAEYIESVWQAAKAKGDLPPIERPEQGFDPRHSALVQTLRVG